MFIIALLLVVALIGLFVTIGFIIAGAVNFGKDGKRLAAMIAPVSDSAVEIVNTGKGIAEKGKIRFAGYAKHGKRIYVAVKETSDEVGGAARSIDIEQAKTSFTQAAESLTAAQEALGAAKTILELLNKTSK